MTDSSGDFDSVLDNIEKRGWGGYDGNDAAAALDAFIELAPEEQERRQEELRPTFQNAPPLPQNHVNLAICASAAMVDAVAPPVPEALNRDSRTVLLRIFEENAQNGVVDRKQMR
jgi:hypothetical protein